MTRSATGVADTRTRTRSSDVFGHRRADTPEEEEREPPPDYAAEVERQLRIADGERWARATWAEILSHYAHESRRQRYVYPPRRPR